MLAILLIILISTILSYLIIKFIYRKVFKSQKSISKFFVFLGSIALIVFYYTPYSFYLEPSFWEFKRICALNTLPNDEKKYNRILSYFDLNLEGLDWEKLNEKTWKLTEDIGYYRKGVFEYATETERKRKSYRIGMVAVFLSNEPVINRHNIKAMRLVASWNMRRYHISGHEGNMELEVRGNRLACSDIVKENLEVLNDK